MKKLIYKFYRNVCNRVFTKYKYKFKNLIKKFKKWAKNKILKKQLIN